jgi:hypothetical protein
MNKAVYYSTYFANDQIDEQIETKLYNIFTQVKGKLDAETDLLAMRGVGRLHKYRHIVVDDIIELFKSGDLSISGYDLVECLKTYFDKVVSTLRHMIEAGNRLFECANALGRMCNSQQSDEENKILINLLNLSIKKGMLEFYTIRFGIETMLYQVDSEITRQRLFDLVRNNFKLNIDFRRNLIYFATSSFRFTNANKHNAKLHDDVLNLLIENEPNAENLEMLLSFLIDREVEQQQDLENLIKIGERIGKEQFHLNLLHKAAFDSPFAPKLVELLETDSRFSPCSVTQMFLEKVRSGKDPTEAAEVVVWGNF